MSIPARYDVSPDMQTHKMIQIFNIHALLFSQEQNKKVHFFRYMTCDIFMRVLYIYSYADRNIFAAIERIISVFLVEKLSNCYIVHSICCGFHLRKKKSFCSEQPGCFWYLSQIVNVCCFHRKWRQYTRAYPIRQATYISFRSVIRRIHFL